MNVLQKVAASLNNALGLLLGEGVQTASEKMKKDNPTYPNIC
ncbi:hypothetical protein ACFLYQ_00915 [Chloroflexota bacterium]